MEIFKLGCEPKKERLLVLMQLNKRLKIILNIIFQQQQGSINSL